MEKRLNSRQKIFCEGYIASGNAYKSALAAGYSEHTAKSGMRHLLQKPWVAEYIEQRQRELAQTVVDTDRIIRELTAIAFFDIHQVAQVEDGVLTVADTKALSWEQRAPIAMLKQGPKGVEMKLYDKLQALGMLGRMTGMTGEGRREAAGDGGERELKIEVVVVE